MRIRIIDAFVTDGPFTGNPAGVCVLAEPRWPDEGWMQQVAAEMNLSETAFTHPRASDPDADWALRWFTPLAEVNLCGHATLATAHALDRDGKVSGPVRFATRSGVLGATVGDDGRVALDFPAATVSPTAPPADLAESLGVPVLKAYTTGSLGDLVVEVADESTVRAARPDYAALAALPHRGVVVTSVAPDGASYDFVSRFFAPRVGVHEDPVTGSAHTALAPLWSQRFGRSELLGLQASRRSGLVHTVLDGERVHLSGQAVTVLDGTLHA
ncbi:MAG TPA: PhzF family phenazine biosynthesis protein [Pseudonocardia sp.]|jgi:PhzF family phenazine biosynthesis protein|nr:PhzF family phenazine biosynthesis protein [Pseudonocardia sp.]